MLSRTAWLASYPKSGNTWVRALLSSLERDGEPSLVTLDPGGRGDRLDSELGVSLGDLSDAEADAMIRTSWANARLASGQFIRRKTHNAWVPGADGFPIPWQPEGARAVYIVRDPRAIAVSFAHHMGFTHETAVAIMASAEWSTSIDRREATSSWSRNVGSWLDDCELPLLLVTYEELSANTPAQLTRIAKFLDLPTDEERIDRAVSACSFTTLAAREIVGGFSEATAEGRPFFRRGEVDSWREELSPYLAERICGDHGDMMKRLGYL